ncbi:hypothetical protein SOCE26_084370 [Sorangium cellulosum]|uniref:Secreted protein n=1 Tax=Sorangium cellulosum TaxID=56 RepID=A0A2L0F5X6_SORCE|nr:hypothetical protein [Sorangium cellulosum]AUX46927.1 hypothetical protein SOCE26_084370 [Sorangium cellulosum]
MIQLRRIFYFLCACTPVVVPAPVQALELSGGVSVGGIQVGTEPELAVSPFLGVLWRRQKDFRIEVHHMLSVVPGSRVGVYDRTAIALGYDTKTGNVSLGPSLSVYSMPVCGAVICDRVVGIAPGGRAQSDWYFAGRLGASASVNVDWAGGSSRVLPGNLVVMVTAGPVWRFGGESK